MPQAPLFPLVDGMLDGNLAAILRGYRAEGLTPAKVRDRMLLDHRVDVSVDTVRRWLAGVEADA